jgi:cyclin K
MYLASKLSKFEVENWQGRKHQHLRWWDVFVEDITMDLLEGTSPIFASNGYCN